MDKQQDEKTESESSKSSYLLRNLLRNTACVMTTEQRRLLFEPNNSTVEELRKSLGFAPVSDLLPPETLRRLMLGDGK